MPRFRRKRPKPHSSESDDVDIEYTDEYDLELISQHGSRHSSTAGRQQRAVRPRRTQQGTLFQPAPHALPATDPAGPAHPSEPNSAQLETQAHVHEPEPLLSSPEDNAIRTECSQDRYHEYVAGLKVDLAKSCVVVATDDKEASCIAVAAYQDCGTSVGIHVSISLSSIGLLSCLMKPMCTAWRGVMLCRTPC